jgi:hypothetical protein
VSADPLFVAPTTTSGIVYALGAPEAVSSGRRQFVELSILVCGAVFRRLLIDKSALTGLAVAMQRLVEADAHAANEAAEVVARLRKSQ